MLSTVATIVQMSALLAATSLQTLQALSVPLICTGAAAVAYGALSTLKIIRHEVPAARDTGRAFTTNTLTKIAIAYMSGNRRFAAQVIPGLILTLGAAWTGWT